jgi:hypothetical protein
MNEPRNKIFKSLTAEVREKYGSSEALLFHVHVLQPIIEYFKNFDEGKKHNVHPVSILLNDLIKYPKKDFLYETTSVGGMKLLKITHIPSGFYKRLENNKIKSFFKQKELLYLELVIELIKNNVLP